MTNLTLQVSIAEQRLTLFVGNEIRATYSVSTALKGVGQQVGSEQTPLGRHEICAMIGANEPIDTVFVGRKPTGEVFTPELAQQFPERDFILSRIMWLNGLEPGFNTGDGVDSKARYIYIHGAPPSKFDNKPSSHGCINMQSVDVIDLFGQVGVGAVVQITE